MAQLAQLTPDATELKRRRPGRPKSDKWMTARGLTPLSAAEVMAWHGERRMWHRLLNSEDDRVVLQAWLNLVAWRDGKPSQQINVTSTQLTLNASDLEKARAIVQEIRASVIPRLGTEQPIKVDDQSEQRDGDDGEKRSLMLLDDGAAKKDG